LASPGTGSNAAWPNTILSRSVKQSEMLKSFHSHQLWAPKTAGRAAAAPLAPLLMQQCSTEHK